jgi:hypothetical protein
MREIFIYLSASIPFVSVFLGCVQKPEMNQTAESRASSQEKILVPRIASGGVDKVPEIKDGSGLSKDVLRPSYSCGEQGIISERIADCKKKNPTTSQVPFSEHSQNGAWSLVVLAADGSEVWRDNQTNLVWSDRIGWQSQMRFNWCHASGSNNKVYSQQAESDPFFWCSTQRFQNQFAPISLCAEDSISLNGTQDSDSGKGGLGILRGASTPIAWRLPSISDFQSAFAHGAGKIFPRLDKNSNPPVGRVHSRIFWTSSVFSSNRRQAWVFDFGLGKADLNFRSLATHSVRCVASDNNL